MLQKMVPFPFPIYFPPLHYYRAYVACQIHVGKSHASITVLVFFFRMIAPVVSTQSKSSPCAVKINGKSLVDTVEDEQMLCLCWEA